MGKVWAVAVASAVAVALMGMLGSSEYVHFRDTHQNCDAQDFTVIDHCMELYDNADWEFFLKYDDGILSEDEYHRLMCILGVEAIECVETAMCFCHYDPDHPNVEYGLYCISCLISNNNNDYQCWNITHDGTHDDAFTRIEESGGLNCTGYNFTLGELAVEVSWANDPDVIAIAESCEGMLGCYVQYDEEAAVAVYNKDIHTACRAIDKLIECVVNASCDCYQTDNETMIDWVHTEKDWYRSSCHHVVDFPAFDMHGITCPGVGKCNSSDPGYECLLEWSDADDAAGSNLTKQCIAERDWANCTESMACECGLFQDSLYYQNLANSKRWYEFTMECEPLAGPFPNHTGINCTDERFTEEEKFFMMALEQVGFVNADEARCSGVLQCYSDSLDAVSEAFRNKDLVAMCQLDAERFTCLEARYCVCEILDEPDVRTKLENLEDDFDNWCTEDEATIQHPVCYDCGSADEQNTCVYEHTKVHQAWYLDEYCLALLSLAMCTETVACDCGFYTQSAYYHNLSIARFNYYSNNCSDYRGEFPSHESMQCPVGPGGLKADLVSVALAETEYVKAEEDACPGIRQCYIDSDNEHIQAYRRKDLNAICRLEEDRILCVEDRYCQCGQKTDPETVMKIVRTRSAHNDLCYHVTGMMTEHSCRNESMCRTADPLSVCDAEFDMGYSAAETPEEACQTMNRYLLCMEDVGCLCGLLSNGSSKAAMEIHNITMFGLKEYHEMSCHEDVPPIQPEEDGIQCAGQPDDDTQRKIVLSYADTSEVAALVSECYRVHKCFRDDDRDRAKAITSRNYVQYCQVQSDLIDCLDEAYCRCGMNGTEKTEAYLTMQMNIHHEYCDGHVPEIKRKECVSLDAELKSQCEKLKDCTEDVDKKLAEALFSKNYIEFCQEKWTFIRCVDEALCQCELDGTDNAKDYRELQLSYHQEYCQSCSPILETPKNCDLREFDEECKNVKTCQQHYEHLLAGAVCNQERFCKEKKNLIINCLDEVICECHQNGTAKATRYRNRELEEYNAFCNASIGHPKKCFSIPTGAAGKMRLSELLLALILLAGLTGASWNPGMP